jgi:hypothetical protein
MNTASQAEDALKEIQERVNESGTGYCCKFAASDMKGKDARAIVLFSDTKLNIQNSQPSSSTTWGIKIVKNDTDYEKLCLSAVDALNQLTEYQQLYASIAFTNSKGHDSCLAIYYPEE